MIKEQDFIKFLTINQGIVGNTIRTYSNRFRIITAWLEDNNLELTNENVINFLYEQKNALRRSNSTVNTYRNVFLLIDKYCKYHKLPFGFTEGTKNLPKTHPDITILSEIELEQLLSTNVEYKNRNGKDNSNLDDKYLTLTEFLAITGCRFDEAASLQIKRLDIENGKAYLVQTKNGDNRNVYFEGDNLKTTLRRLIQGRNSEELVFTGSTGNKILPGTFNENLRLRGKLAGISKFERLHAHILRHTFATHILQSGADITIVSKLLGHKDIRVTYETYIHLADTTLQKAVRKHPLLRKYENPQDRIDEFLEAVNKFKFGADKRFDFKINGENNTYNILLSLAPDTLNEGAIPPIA